jgi:hypothetical protein
MILCETGSKMPLSPMLLLYREGEETLVMCTGKLVAFYFVCDGKEEEEEEEEEVIVLAALL